MKDIAIGQVWICPPLGAAPPLVCVVGRIDLVTKPTSPPSAQRVISVSVTPSAAARDAGWPAIAHLPIEAAAFRASTLTLSGHQTQPGPAFAEGHATWWAKVAQGRAGAFAVPLAEAYLGVVSTARP